MGGCSIGLYDFQIEGFPTSRCYGRLFDSGGICSTGPDLVPGM